MGVLLGRFKPLAAPFLRRLMSPDQPDEETLQPEETQSVRPPALLPGMLDRVTGTDEHSDLSYHMGVATASVVTHVPVLRRTYRNAIARHSGFATWRKSERYGNALNMGQLAGAIQSVPKLRYCHNQVSWRYFGHWMSDALPAAHIDPDQGQLWISPDPSWDHAYSYLNVFDLAPPDAPVFHAEELVVYQDFGQGSHKRARYATLRDKLQAQFGGADGPECVYLRRGASGDRRVVANDAALTDQLLARHWTVLDVTGATVDDLQQALCNARVVVGMEGSHLNHAQLSLRPQTCLIILVPHDRFTTIHIGRCNAKQISTGMVVLNGTQAEGYHADLDEILRTVDLADRGPPVA